MGLEPGEGPGGSGGTPAGALLALPVPGHGSGLRQQVKGRKRAPTVSVRWRSSDRCRPRSRGPAPEGAGGREGLSGESRFAPSEQGGEKMEGGHGDLGEGGIGGI